MPVFVGQSRLLRQRAMRARGGRGREDMDSSRNDDGGASEWVGGLGAAVGASDVGDRPRG